MVKKSSKSPAAATAAARSKIKPAGGSSKRKGGKNVKSFWKYFCSSLVTVLFFWGLHSLAAQFNPAYKTFVDKQFNRLRSALSQGAENLKPEPTITISTNTTELRYDNLKMGIPSGRECDVILDRVGYALGYSELYEQPWWVTYKLTADEVKSKKAKRSDDFRSDPDIPSGSATPEDYKNSGFDRGHLAPAADMSFSLQAMSESFYMSNMSPQYANFNRGIWKDLESKVRDYAVYNKEIYVVTGPVFGTQEVITIGSSNKIAVPDHYYKVILDASGSEPKAIGFLLNHRNSKGKLADFVVTVDAVEAITGLDFFSQLDDDIESRVESQCDFQQWENTLPVKLRSK